MVHPKGLKKSKFFDRDTRLFLTIHVTKYRCDKTTLWNLKRPNKILHCLEVSIILQSVYWHLDM